MQYILRILLLCFPLTLHALEKADTVLVVKSEGKLYLKSGSDVLYEIDVVFGRNPKGHKYKQGDKRTPEGRYELDFKNTKSRFYKSIHISYPNAMDKHNAQEQGVDPGGDIMIHGQKNGYAWFAFIMQRFNWTEGCIAVTNSDMDLIWDTIDIGTPIEILP